MIYREVGNNKYFIVSATLTLVTLASLASVRVVVKCFVFLSSANEVSTGPTCQFGYVCLWFVCTVSGLFFQGFICLNDQAHFA